MRPNGPVRSYDNQRGVKNYNPYLRRSPTPEKKDEVETENSLRKKMKDELKGIKQMLHHKRKYYQMEPEKHPLYQEEWNKYWEIRSKNLQLEGKNPSKHNFKPEWKCFWKSLMKKKEKEDLKAKKTELLRKYNMADQESQVSSSVNPDCTDNTRKPVKFVVAKKTPLFDAKTIEKQIQTVSFPKTSSSETPKAGNKPKFVPISSNVFSPPSDTAQRSSDPDLLEVVRTLSTLEDKLGSSGPKITMLLSRVLAAERRKPGSSSKLLQDDPGDYLVKYYSLGR